MQTEPIAQAPRGGYEKRDVNVRALAIFVVAMFVSLAVTAVVMAGLFRVFSRVTPVGSPPASFVNKRVLPPEPRLQTDPQSDLERFREREQTNINSYGWVDPAKGIVKIPVDRAMDLILQKGLQKASPDDQATAKPK